MRIAIHQELNLFEVIRLENVRQLRRFGSEVYCASTGDLIPNPVE